MFRNITEIHVNQLDYGRRILIVPERVNGDGTYSLGYLEDGIWKFATINENEVEPYELRQKFLSIPMDWAKEILNGLIKILGHPEKEATAQALDATKIHLEDMRKLVFDRRIK